MNPMTEEIIADLYRNVFLKANPLPVGTPTATIQSAFMDWVEKTLKEDFPLDAVEHLDRLRENFDDTTHFDEYQNNFGGWVYQQCQEFILEYKSPPSPPMARIIEALEG